MKRFGALMMTVLLVAMLVIPAYAAGDTVFTITPSVESAAYGEEITFTVSISGSTPYVQAGIIPQYDTAVFELVRGRATVSVADPDEAGYDVLFKNFSEAGGIAFQLDTEAAHAGKIGTFVLKVIAEGGVDATTVTAETSVNGAGGVSLSSSVNAASVAIQGSEPEHTHNLIHVEAIAPACHYVGNIEYWYCADETCMMVWADEALTQLTNLKNVVVPALGGEVEHVAESCWNTEYWRCDSCEQVWADEALTQLTNIKNVNKAEATHDLVHVEAKEPAVGVEGNIEYWYCSVCETVWSDAALTQVTNFKNVIIPALVEEGCAHANLVHMEAVEAACHYNGNIEHWVCYDCETVWADEALTQLTNIKNVVVPAIGGEVAHFDAIEAGCHYEGNIEYWVCYECEQVWQDAALTQLTNIKNVIVPAVGGEVEHVAESCWNIEYWTCASCEQVWQDAALTQLTNIKNVNKAEATHVIEAVAESCYNTAYWYCSACETYWADEALTQITNSKNVIKAEASHALKHVEAKEAAVGVEGNIEHWYCETCETVWADAALTQITNFKNVIIPALKDDEVVEDCAHAGLVHMDAVEPGCHYEGNIEYWVCYDCEIVWQDAALTQLTNIKNVVVPAVGGEVEHVAESCWNIEYWRCDTCEQVWQDAALTQLTNIKNVNKAEASHEVEHVAESCWNVEYWTCGICESYWADEALTQVTNSKNVIKAEASHEVEHVAESCWNVEYWTCAICESYWADEALTQVTNSKNVIKAQPHNAEHVAESCWNVEHWFCADCEGFFADEALTQVTNSKNVIKAEPSHKVEHIEAKAPTCDKNGNVEYWFCAECESCWANKECTQVTNVKNVQIAANGHSFDKEGICTVCGASETQTGDTAMIMVWVAVMALAAVAFVVVSKKRVA